jgi:hypothetical protein
VYRNDGKGGFERLGGGTLDNPVTRDQTSVVGLGGSGGWMIGSANYEDGLTNGGCIRIYDWGRKVSGESVRGEPFSAGPLALGDLDGDEDVDLLVGGRVVAGRYPEGADTLVMRNEGGRLAVAQRMERVGLVSGVVLSDLDGDGQLELVLACEWGPIRIFKGKPGKFQEITRELGLESYVGWWNGVSAGDFDNDGRLDLAASNWGLNSRYQTSQERPLKIYYGNFGGASGLDVVEAYRGEGAETELPVRGLKAVASALPWVREEIKSFADYGKARIDQIYGDRLKQARVVSVTELRSMVFLNRGARFEARALPAEAQWTPAFGVCVGDYDGDGNEDLFLSQNFFGVNPEMTRCDGGRGLWLRGDGRGNFRPVSSQESGVKIYGEQRGAALSDYDEDGRVDLVVAQNGAATRLFRNKTGRPGLRVRLKGPAGNPNGVGARVRMKFGERWGAAREIHAGGGYWSQDSAVAVMGIPESPTGIEVRWPGGKEVSYAVPPNAAEVDLRSSGEIKLIK